MRKVNFIFLHYYIYVLFLIRVKLNAGALVEMRQGLFNNTYKYSNISMYVSLVFYCVLSCAAKVTVFTVFIWSF